MFSVSSPATVPRALTRAASTTAVEDSLPARNATVAARAVTLPVSVPTATPKAAAGVLATTLSTEVQRPGTVLVPHDFPDWR